MFVRRSKYTALEAELEELQGSVHRREQWRLQYKARLLQQERDFPIAKREICNELIHWLHARYKSPGDWAAPDVPDATADHEIRRILAAIPKAHENHGVALAGLTKKLGAEPEDDRVYRSET